MTMKGQIISDFRTENLHRLSGNPRNKRDYDIKLDGLVKSYGQPTENGISGSKWGRKEIPKGFSSFIPINSPHGHFGKEPPPDCFTIGCELPPNWQAVYTGVMRLRLMSGDTTNAYHYHIYPTVDIPEEEFISAVKTSELWPWVPCSLRGNGYLAEDLWVDGDDDTLEPEIRNVLYYLSQWYLSETDHTSRLLINSVYTWIAIEKPELAELADDLVRCRIVQFNINNYCQYEETDAQGVAVLNDISCQLEEYFNKRKVLVSYNCTY